MDAAVRELTIAELIALVSTLVFMVGVLIGVFRILIPLMRRLSNLTDDWFGEEARPGVSARLGVMERLERQDMQLAMLRLRLGEVDGEESIPVQMTALDRRVLGNSHRIRALEHLLRRHMRESEMWVTEVKAKARSEREFEVPPWPHLRDDDDNDGEPSP